MEERGRQYDKDTLKQRVYNAYGHGKRVEKMTGEQLADYLRNARAELDLVFAAVEDLDEARREDYLRTRYPEYYERLDRIKRPSGQA